MGFFAKKSCDVCGKKIGLMGNRKLEDGNLCKDCAKGLSPFFSDRRKSTVNEIKEQLAYREENRQELAKLNPSLTLGRSNKIIIDEAAGKFIVTSSKNWQDENPDVIDISQVTGTHLDVSESQKEVTYKDKQGNQVSYDPPRKIYTYNFNMTIHINSPWFDTINFKLNPLPINVEPQHSRIFIQGGAQLGRTNHNYREYEAMAEEIRIALTQRRPLEENYQANNFEEPASPPPSASPSGKCPFCGAMSSSPDNKFCEYCGGSMQG